MVQKTSKAKHQILENIKAAVHPNFYRLHFTYFIVAILISSAILWGANTPDFQVRYIDALFLCCSAICNTGLTTINLGSINGFQQSVLFVMMLMGDLTLITVSVVVVRRHYFGKRIKELVTHSDAARRVAVDIERSASRHSTTSYQPQDAQISQRHPNQVVDDRAAHMQPRQSARHRYPRSMSGYGGFPSFWNSSLYGKVARFLYHEPSRNSILKYPYLSFTPKLDHKGRFHSLTREQEQELGGVEYRALKLLSWLLPTYTCIWISVLMVVLTPYVSHTNLGDIIRTSQPGNTNPAWWAVFASVSSYTNTGLSLLDESMIPLSKNSLLLIFTAIGTLPGNTLYPVFLRATIWILSKLVPTGSKTHQSLLFLLHHPRRCYLFLFPAASTYILLAVQITVSVVTWVLFLVLNISYTPVDPLIPTGLRVFQGLYESVSLRASGFYVILISDVAPAFQFFSMVVMYIGAFPIIMSLRESNVYEERSLGQMDEVKLQIEPNGLNKQGIVASNLGQHIRRQLTYDIWWIMICAWLVSIIERDKLAPNPPASSTPQESTSLASPHPAFYTGLFGILFEVVSAYGTVGLSLGVPYNNYSFCGAWQSLSKLVLMSVMLRGRHRILPMAIDRAILLPGQHIMEEMDKMWRIGHETPEEWRSEEEEIRRKEEGDEVQHENEEATEQ